jgi:hypothetical protein
VKTLQDSQQTGLIGPCLPARFSPKVKNSCQFFVSHLQILKSKRSLNVFLQHLPEKIQCIKKTFAQEKKFHGRFENIRL